MYLPFAEGIVAPGASVLLRGCQFLLDALGDGLAASHQVLACELVAEDGCRLSPVEELQLQLLLHSLADVAQLAVVVGNEFDADRLAVPILVAERDVHT